MNLDMCNWKIGCFDKVSSASAFTSNKSFLRRNQNEGNVFYSTGGDKSRIESRGDEYGARCFIFVMKIVE